MSFLHSCILLLGILATGFAASAPVDLAASPVPASSVLPATAGTRAESPAKRLLRHAFGDGEAGQRTAGAEGTAFARDSDEPGSAIPGAFVAVIFGVFGLLVIARRSRR